MRDLKWDIHEDYQRELQVLYDLFVYANDATPKRVQVFCPKRDNAGRAFWPERVVTVPAFVFNDEKGRVWSPRHSSWIDVPKKPGYVEYYLAHELAHIYVFDYHGLRGDKIDGDHGERFMSAFKSLCPIQWQHYEYEYKPDSARKSDVSVEGAGSHV